jgi:orotidine-5'-phosphate decarboxylase
MIQLNEKEELARRRVCLPLDGLNTMDELRSMVRELSPVVGLFKVGKESYTRFGPEAIEAVHKTGADVFLDLKYHDIPNTVKGAARAAAEMQVYMFNVHASGGIKMMEAAVEGANSISLSNAYVPNIVGVTMLTSIDQKMMNEELGIPGTVEEAVLRLAKNSQKAGLDGIVCSAADLYAIRDQLPTNFMYVTPGIQGTSTPAGEDQKRVFSPGNAVRDGSSILVIGRAITGPKTPEARLQAGYEVLQDMAKYL